MQIKLTQSCVTQGCVTQICAIFGNPICQCSSSYVFECLRVALYLFSFRITFLFRDFIGPFSVHYREIIYFVVSLCRFLFFVRETVETLRLSHTSLSFTSSYKVSSKSHQSLKVSSFSSFQ